MEHLEKALSQIVGTAECMRADLKQDLDADEMRAVERTYLETLEEVTKLIIAAMCERKE